jgi:hypothetical protein
VITRPLVDVYTKAVEKAGERVVGAIGDAMTFGMDRTFADDVTSQSMGGQAVTLRVTYVKMASEGLYPILKDSELLECRHCRRSLSDCTCAKFCSIKDAPDCQVLPAYPGARVAYQCHKVVVVEPFGPAPAAAAVPAKDIVTFGLFSGMAFEAGVEVGVRLNPDIVGALNEVLFELPTQCNFRIRILGVSEYLPAGAPDLARVEAVTATYQLLDAGLQPLPDSHADGFRAAVQAGITADLIAGHPKSRLRGLRMISLNLVHTGGP